MINNFIKKFLNIKSKDQKTKIKRLSLVINLHTKEFLFNPEKIRRIQRVVEKFAPKWSETLSIRSIEKATEFKLKDSDSLYSAMKKEYEDIEKPFGDSIHKVLGSVGPEGENLVRINGMQTISGSYKGLKMNISFDEIQLHQSIRQSPSGISFWITRKEIEGKDANYWAEEIFIALIKVLPSVYGEIYIFEESRSKGYITYKDDKGTIEMGINHPSKFDGLYWINYFGKNLCDLIGKSNLLSSPCYEIKKIGDGVMLKLDSLPQNWQTPKYRKREAQVKNHLGKEYFVTSLDKQKIIRQSKKEDKTSRPILVRHLLREARKVK